jgi:DNA-binding transcriptional LysR family regulator
MNLQQLRYLVAVGDTPSLSAAARAVGVSQPVLSRAVRTLERELGVELLRLDGRRLVLTERGLAVLATARSAVRAVDGVARAARPPAQVAPLLVAAMPRHQSLLAPFLPALAALPDVVLRVVSASSVEDVVRLVVEREVELGFGNLPVRSPELEYTAAATVEAVLLSPRGTDLPPVVRADDLEAVRLVAPAANTGRRRAMGQRILGDAAPPPAVEAEDRTLLVAAVQAGLGSTIESRAAAEGLDGVEVRSFDPPVSVDYVFARRPGPPSDGAAALLEATRTAAVRDPEHPWGP